MFFVFEYSISWIAVFSDDLAHIRRERENYTEKRSDEGSHSSSSLYFFAIHAGHYNTILYVSPFNGCIGQLYCHIPLYCVFLHIFHTYVPFAVCSMMAIFAAIETLHDLKLWSESSWLVKKVVIAPVCEAYVCYVVVIEVDYDRAMFRFARSYFVFVS